MYLDIVPLNEKCQLPWEKERIVTTDKSLPSMSIVIPVFNSGAFLEKTLRSLLCNDLSGVEIIMQDGGSNDNSHSIIHHYKDMFAQIYSEKDEGQSDAINKGYQKSNGDILYWLNGDDIILPNTIIKVREYFAEHPECNVLVGDAYMTEIDFKPINHFKFNETKLQFDYLLDYAKNHLIQPSVFFTQEAWNSIGPLNIDDHYAMDADLFIGMARKYKFHHIPLDIAYSVYHEECKTRGARAESISALALVQAKHGGTQQAKNTLSILTDLYNELQKKVDSLSQHETLASQLELTTAELNDLKKLVDKKKQTLLQADLEAES
ncbi:glycosyltransferase family 2 protein [Gilvimarinus sp. DA14]|uniref:glycosyltransferase family 2 protein n=1 Tax=Gilvimarinus sp. DA14 TaxID=2956798 RepID=UPI0020B78A45|nr:glycosyltransferase family 2 protein [Gilvimarinus sp. DA14]UTF59560.1 glycosyltransferase [Gilvimarinus sp. DA14]